MPSPTTENHEAPLFRPTKKRKVYRRRGNEEEEEVTDSISISTAPASTTLPSQTLDELIASATSDLPATEGKGEEDGLSIAEILRLRKGKRVRGGVGFSVADSSGIRGEEEGEGDGTGAGDNEGREVVEAERQTDGNGITNGVRKFAPQTGMVGDVDRHMMAFIDSRLAQSRLETSALHLQHAPTNTISRFSHESREGEKDRGQSVNEKGERQPASVGKLLEIDLGDEARRGNVERTDKARRKLDGEEMEEEGRKTVKVRLGPDGKPWRGKKRRGSVDVQRDRLVEDVLRENRLEIYDEPPPEPQTINDDQAADDRIAEAFRKEFMDAVSQRQRKKAGPPQPASRNVGGKKQEEELKGPKLGGSRSARAAMKEMMLKAAKK